MAIWWFWPQIKPWIKQALGNIVTQKTAAPVKFPSSMKPAVAPWVVWWLWNVVTPKQVTTLKTDIEKKKQQDATKQQEQVAAQSAQLAKSANTFKDLYYDVAKWTDEQILKAYPELWGDATIIKKIRQNPQIAVDLYYDLQKPWVTQERISQAYPELYWADNAKWWVLNYLMWMGKQSVSTFGTNLVSWALDLVWADKAREKVQGFQEFVKGEEEASLRRQWFDPSSKAFAAGETTSNIAISTVPTLPLWWAWFGATKSIANPVLRGLAGSLVGWTQWFVTTNIATAGSEWRKATATENIIGWWVWALLWWIGWYRSGKADKAMEKLFSEKGTSPNFIKAAESGRAKFTNWLLSKKAEITPTERVANGAKIISQKIKGISANDPQKVIIEAGKYGKKMATELADDLWKIKIGTMTKFKAQLWNQIDEVAKLSDEWTASQVKAIKALKAKIPQAKSADDLWKIRIEWDDLFSSAQKNLATNPAPTTAKANRLRQSVRRIMNDELDDVVRSQWWPDVKAKFYDMSSIIEARDILIKNIPELAKETPTTFWKIVKYAGGTALWLWWASWALNKLWGE